MITISLTNEQHSLLIACMRDVYKFNKDHKDLWEDRKDFSNCQRRVKRLTDKIEATI